MNPVLQLGLNSLGSKLDELKSLIELVTQKNISTPNLDISNVLSKGSIMLIASYFEDFILYTATEYVNLIIREKSDITKIPNGITNSVREEIENYVKRVFRNIYSEEDTFIELTSKVNQRLSNIESLFKFVEGDLTSNITNRIIKTEFHLRANEINRLFKIAGINNICSMLSKRENLGKLYGFEYKNQILKNYTYIQRNLEKHLAEFYKYRNSLVHPYNKASMPYTRTLPEEINFFRAFALDLCKLLDSNL